MRCHDLNANCTSCHNQHVRLPDECQMFSTARSLTPTHCSWVDGTPLRYPLGPVLEDWGYAPANCGFLDLWLNSTRDRRIITGDVRAGSCDNINAFVCETSE